MPSKSECLKTIFKKRFSTLGFGVVGTLLCLITSQSWCFEVTCIERPVRFNGIPVLNYAMTSSGDSTTSLMYQKIPIGCTNASSLSCGASSPLPDGAIVAVGKTCGQWAYVQFIGESKITTGWTPLSRLVLRSSKLPFDAGIPPDKSEYFAPTTATFGLKNGRGVPVCEAYLQRLNQTVFHEPPYCGRPENDQVPGFKELHRVPLSGAEFRQLYGHVKLLGLEGSSHADASLENLYDQDYHVIPDIVGSWTYEPAVDIENVGVGVRLVVWGAEPSFPVCGSRYRETGADIQSEGSRRAQFIVALTKDGSSVDEIKTKELFGRPIEKTATDKPEKAFEFLGESMSIFEYRGVYYYDTFLAHHEQTEAKSKKEAYRPPSNRLAIFLRRGGATERVCQYSFDDSERASPFVVRQ